MMSSKSFILMVIAVLSFSDVEALPIGSTFDLASMTTEEVMKYLVRYGYLEDKTVPSLGSAPQASSSASGDNATTNSSSANNSSDTTTAQTQPETAERSATLYKRGQIPRAIGDFQDFMSIKKTMVLDEQTIRAMTQPRCGVEDKRPHASWLPDLLFRRKRRYVTETQGWSKMALTYAITQPSAKLAIVDQQNVLKLAFNRWAEVTPLTFAFTQNQQGADINVRFASASHGDGKPFDGPGNTLAHAFYPLAGGDVHFDEDESWVTGLSTIPSGSKSLLQVAVHEIGHALGLKHSSVQGAIMGPVYQTGTTVELGNDDIQGIQSLYGQCSTSINTVFSWIANGRTYFFKGSNTWRFDDTKSESEKRFPKPIATQWIGVPNDIDEAFLWGGNWVTYFFKGSQYWRYNDQLDRAETVGYPKAISTGWPGIPDNIDAAFSLNSTVSYFFKGNQCYMFDSPNDQLFPGYPKTISECFPGVPDNLDSAVRYYWDNVVYFFKGLYFYQWDPASNIAQGPTQIHIKWRNLCFT